LKLINKFILTILCVCLSLNVLAQQFSISGNILDETNRPIAYANILLLVAQDSTIVTGTTSDDFGKFTITEIDSGNYFLKISFIGFEDFLQQVSLVNNIELESIVLKESAVSLSQVEITYIKPTFKREADRLVFNIENTALTEGTMLQVLKSTPGILVLDRGITIKGSEPTIYINDRKVNLSSSDLTQLLESSSANSIKSVEVITNPSAKYDADSGKVINIIMSKNLITGYRGSVFTNYTQGVFPRYNLGTSHFFKNSKTSFNINYSYNDNKINRNGVNVINFLDNNNAIEEIWTSTINRNTWSQTHNFSFNFDYFINDKNTLSLSSAMLYLPYLKSRDFNNTIIADDNLAFSSRFDANTLSRDEKYNLGFDLDFVHLFTKGQLALNSHYTTYNLDRSQNVFSNSFDQNNTFQSASEFNTNSNQETTIFTSKIDYSLPINDTSNFEAGVKYSNIKTESDIIKFDIDVNTGNQQIDLQNTDAFNYDEKVFAAYSNYSLNTDKWSLNLGLRAEQTDIKGVSVSNNQTNTQDYLEWFSNASLQYNISDGYNVYANYKRSITRPVYTYLNPFKIFLNESAVVVGNPNLTPVFKDRFVIGWTLFDIFTIEAYYQNFDGEIYEFPLQNNDTNIISYTPINLDKKIDFGLDISTYFNVTDDWSLYFGTSFYNIKEETNFVNGFVKLEQRSIYSILQNDFSFLKDKSLSVNLALSWAGKNLQGLAISEDRLLSYLSISKTILKKKGTISLLVSDLFNLHDFDASNRYLNQFNTRTIDADDRYIKLGFRYKFGNTKLATNERTKELEELDRLNESEH